MAEVTAILVPTAPSEQARLMVETLQGCIVGFIDNAKPNFEYLVDDLAELLGSRYGVGKIMKRRKRAASIPAPETMIEELAETCDLVITGSGD